MDRPFVDFVRWTFLGATMREFFEGLSDQIFKLLSVDELLICNFYGEDSHFCRFNHGLVRQVGEVLDQNLSLRLVNGQRHVVGTLSLSGVLSHDVQESQSLLQNLRSRIATVPDDPYLLLPEIIASTARTDDSKLTSAADIVAEISRIATKNKFDLVGFFAQGGIHYGHASSIGQRNWYSSFPFNFDWSLYLSGQKAVKQSYAGFEWNFDTFLEILERARPQLEILEQNPIKIPPGSYPTYLAPAAISEICRMIQGGFSEKDLRTKSSPLVRLHSGASQFSTKLSLADDLAGGVAPNFDEFGFTLPSRVALVEGGKLKGTLISPRSAKEFRLKPNAVGTESPLALDMSAGRLEREDILTHIGTGLWVNNLWYLNYSDLVAGRITGMTRFVSFWVEEGKIKAPLEPMRFDDSMYRMFGENLLDFTEEREFFIDDSTYLRRSVKSERLPGALLKSMNFTL
jgi:predicted Zn-dependent protease